VTLYVILGDGEMPPKEIKHQLDDLWKQCEEADTDFWFAMIGKPEPTETDKNIVSYFTKNNIHYGLFVADHDSLGEYEGVSEYFDFYSNMATKQAEAVTDLMTAVREESGAAVLALFTDDEEKDAELVETLGTVLLAGFKVYGLNDSMMPVELLTEEVKPMPEDTIEPKQVDTARRDHPAPVDEDDEPEPLNRQYLESLTANDVKDIARGMGLTPGNKAETINAILVAAGVEKASHQHEVSVSRSAADTQVTEPIGPASAKQNTSSTEGFVPHLPDRMILDDEQVLVVIHTKTGMSTQWTTLQKVRDLL